MALRDFATGRFGSMDAAFEAFSTKAVKETASKRTVDGTSWCSE